MGWLPRWCAGAAAAAALNALLSGYLAVAFHREHGFRASEALDLSLYGLVHGADNPDTAEHHQRAVAIAREIGDLEVEAEVLNNIGETLRTNGYNDQAQQRHESALALARDVDNHNEQARAHHGIAYIMRASGRPDEARAHWRQALALYTELGLPLAGEIQTRLAALAAPDAVNQPTPQPGSAGK